MTPQWQNGQRQDGDADRKVRKPRVGEATDGSNSDLEDSGGRGSESLENGLGSGSNPWSS